MNTTTEAAAEAPTGTARLVDIAAVPALLGVSVPTVERQHAAGNLPAPRRIGRAIRWQLDELVEWMSRPGKGGRLLPRAEWAAVWQQLVKRRPRAAAN